LSQNDRFYIENDKIVLPVLVSPLTYGCNLKCEQCSAFSPYTHGTVSKEELLNGYKAWVQRIQPTRIELAGGEPFLHPNYEEIIIETKNIWKDTKDIIIVTNGLLLPKVSDVFLKQLAESNISLRISLHIDNDEHKKFQNENAARLHRIGVPFRLFDSITTWRKQFLIDESSFPVPAMSNAKRAYQICAGRKCITLINNTLYDCNIISLALHAYLRGHIPPQWSFIKDYQGVSLDHSNEEIYRYLSRKVIKECAACVDTIDLIPPHQISTKKI
jgi:hypothetical protein